MSDIRYLLQGALLECNACKGVMRPFMMGNYRNISIGALPSGNQENTEVGVDIEPFGVCKASFPTFESIESLNNPKPRMCEDFIDLYEHWDDLTPGFGHSIPILRISNPRSLTMDSFLRCKKGGIIRPVTDGQELLFDFEALGFDPAEVILSEDCRYIYYLGQKFKIADPSQGESMPSPYYELYSKTYRADWNIWKAISGGLGLNGPKNIKFGDSGFNNMNNPNAAAVAHILMALVNFAAAGVDNQSVTFMCERDNSGNKRVKILVGNTGKGSTIATGKTIRAYTTAHMHTDSALVLLAIRDSAREAYEKSTNSKVSKSIDFDYKMTISKEHATSDNMGQMYFDDDNNLMYKPFVYSEDRIEIISNDGHYKDLSEGLGTPYQVQESDADNFKEKFMGK